MTDYILLIPAKKVELLHFSIEALRHFSQVKLESAEYYFSSSTARYLKDRPSFKDRES